MEFVANLVRADVAPAAWAREREAQGWHGLACGDHLFAVQTWPHVWVTLTELALATERPMITSSFANNCLRSPVEFVQASLSLQRASAGRFQAGLGAGWRRDEVEQAGLVFPENRDRARRYHEAIQIARALFRDGHVQFKGEHYDVDVPRIGPEVPKPPELGASVGGPWVLEHVTPLVDRVELKPSGRITRTGTDSREGMSSIHDEDVQEMVAAVRRIRTDVPIDMYVFVGVGRDPSVDDFRRMMAGGFFERFFGDPEQVAEALVNLEEYGINRVQITEYVPGSHDLLAPFLFEPAPASA